MKRLGVMFIIFLNLFAKDFTGNKVISEIDANNPRKFMGIYSDGFIGYEFGTKELSNNILIIKNLNTNNYIEIRGDSNHRISPIDIININNEMYILYAKINLNVYEYYDSKQIKFNYKGKDDFVDILIRKFDKINFSLGKEIKLFDLFYGIGMQAIVENDKLIIPWYDFNKSENSTKIGFNIYDKKFNLLDEFSMEYESEFKFVEPSIVKINEGYLLTLRSLNNYQEIIKYITFDNKEKKFRQIEKFNLNTPSSMNKAIRYKNKLIVLFNNIKSKEQGPRNSLDLAILDENLNLLKNINILNSKNDFFSNFSIKIEGKDMVIVYQRLNRNLKNSEALDSIEYLKINIENLIESR